MEEKLVCPSKAKRELTIMPTSELTVDVRNDSDKWWLLFLGLIMNKDEKNCTAKNFDKAMNNGNAFYDKKRSK